ncbi:MAG: NAD(+) synthase [Bacteroidales bacterium]|nr:NAD(+) synthase [Bacteroidales bacterium]
MYPKVEHNYQVLVAGIKRFFGDAGKTSAVLGLSGGIDSAVVLCLVADALGKEHVHGLMMPSPFSTVHSLTDAIKLAEQADISYHVIPIDSIYSRFLKELAPVFEHSQPDTCEENIQARIRACLLMAYANKKDCLLLNTTNKSELAMGYGTLYGDLAGALMVLADVYKTEVYELATFLNSEKNRIPLSIITKEPSAELRANQKDSDSLPPYPVLDPLLHALIEEGQSPDALIAKGEPKEIVEQAVQAMRHSAFKRLQLPPLLKVSQHPLLSKDKWR